MARAAGLLGAAVLLCGTFLVPAAGALPLVVVSADTTVAVTIHKSLPPYHVTLLHDVESGAVNRILITRGDEEDPLQTLSGFPEAEPPPGGRDDFGAIDLNFDGYRDLKLLGTWGATGNRAYLCWLFDPKAGTFSFEPSLFELGNPTPDPAKKTIASRWNGGRAGQVYTEGTYVWRRGALVLIHRERQEWNEARKAFDRFIEERADSGLVVVRRGVQFEAEITEGERFTFDVNDRLYFELDPDPEGWEIAVRAADRPGENLARLTPPLHGPNPRQVWGWHFRNADNTGPNDGSVHAPQTDRPFIFSEKVGQTIQGPGSDRGPTAEEIDAVERDGNGMLMVDDLKLGNLGRGQRATIGWMRFHVVIEYR